MEEAKLKDFEQALRDRISGDVSFDRVTCGIYATDASIYQITPVAVVLPRDEADVCAAVKTAAEYNINILPRGAGTSLGGQAVGPSMVVDFSKYMNKILELNIEDRWVKVQPGIILDELNAELAKHGLLFAPDPATMYDLENEYVRADNAHSASNTRVEDAGAVEGNLRKKLEDEKANAPIVDEVWVELSDLEKYAFATADKKIIEKLASESRAAGSSICD